MPTRLASVFQTLFAAALCALVLSPRAARATETADAAGAADEAPPLIFADTEPAPPPRTFAARMVTVAPRVQQAYSPTGTPAPLAETSPALQLPQSPAPGTGPVSYGALDSSLAVSASPARSERGHLGLVVGASGLEQPVHAELALRFASGFLSARFGGGVVPGAVGTAMLSAVSVPDGSLTSWSAEAGLALHPFRGSFFLGATAGYLSLNAAAPTRLGTVAIAASTLYVTPRFGWMAVWDSGFTLGFEAGAQLPLGPNVIVTGPSNAAAKAESLSRSIAANPLPTAALKLGLLL
jgi:hypothetical protein